MPARLTRRQALGLGFAAAIAGSWHGRNAFARPDGPSLDELARAGGRRFGAVVGGGAPGTLTGSFADPALRALLVAECGLLVSENEMKWAALRPAPDRYDFAAADRQVAFADENGLGFRGHTLLWHHPQWFPAWAATHDFGPHPATAVESMLTDHVAKVAGRYKRKIVSWDVVNEAVDADTGAMRETPFSRHIPAEQVLDIAFHKAREVLPRGQLVYNDYMSWEPGHENHRAGVLRLLEGFRKRGTPVDALGIQSHIGTANTDSSTGFGDYHEAEWRRFVDVAVGMGYDIIITEFDVHDKGLPADIPSRDRAVADYARAYLDLMLSYPQLTDIVTWGMSDRYSWLQNLWLRPDRLPKRPTPYDADFKPKPLRDAIAAALRGATARG
ncbi:endo-1,4-beta-xylanase [Niveispirillum fermenti]|uniref:endo-1,4-beta-xylanase n=1 Tax=Niveispirillum fermenti TaxID=1233113 RepID=UPI003A883B3C